MGDKDYIANARELLADPEVTLEDKQAILEAVPELQERTIEIESPRFLQEQTQYSDPVLGNLSYEDVQRKLEKRELEAMDYQPDNPEIRNESKLASLNTAPSVNQDLPSLFYHFEPSVDEVMEWAYKIGDKRAIRDLKELEEDSQTYKRYADTQWRKVHDTFAKNNEGAIRVKHLDPNSAQNIMDKVLGTTASSAVGIVGGIDDAMALGFGKEALASTRQPYVSEQELVKAGVIRPFAKRIRDVQASQPLLSLGGNIAAFLIPTPLGKGGFAGSLSRAGQAAIAKTGGKKAVRAIAPVIEGGIALGGEGAVEKLGAEMRGEPSVTWGDVAKQAGAGALLSGLVGNIAEGAGDIAMRRVKALRISPEIGEQIRTIERGGGGTTLPFVGEGGIRPPTAYKETQEEIITKHAKAITKGEKPPEIERATTKMAHKIKDPMLSEMHQYRSQANEEIERLNRGYYNATKNVTVNTRSLGNFLLDIINKRSPEDWKLPLSKTEVMDKFVEGLGRKVKTVEGDTVYKWRDLNAEELDIVVTDLDNLLREEANKTNAPIPRDMLQVQQAIRELREQFPSNEFAPDTLRETIMIGTRPKEVKGWAALKTREHRIKNKIESMQEALGVPYQDKLEPDVQSQANAVVNAILKFGSKKNEGNDAVLRDLLKGRPDLIEALDNITSGEAYETLVRSRGKAGFTARNTGGGPGFWATLGLGNIGIYADPLFRSMTGLAEKGGPIGTVTAQREDDIATAAEQALYGASKTIKGGTDAISWLIKAYKKANERGTLEDLKKKEKIR